MYAIKLSWKEFNVNLSMVEQAMKSAHEHYVGNQAASQLELWFSVDPNLLPQHEVTRQRDVVVQEEVEVPTLDVYGQPVLDENDEPMTHMEMQDVTVQEDYQALEPNGDPSVAQLVQEYWDAITEESDEAVEYVSAEQVQADKEAKKASGKAKLAALGLTAEEIAALVG